MEIENITLKKIKDNIKKTDFQVAYFKILLGAKSELDNEELKLLFKLSLLFLNFGDQNLKKLGYHIILKYSLIYQDFKPLFDISINLGYIPISKFIEENHLDFERIENSFFNSFFSSYQENYKEKNIYLSHGQKKLIKFSNDQENNLVLIAPTSYGKSEIIIEKVFKNIKKIVCVIVPSKALLAQTKKRLLEHKSVNKLDRIVTHPEMYKGNEKRFVAVLTQERLLRLLQKNANLKFDLVLIDEAHNLMKKDNRATLLSQVILILYKRNDKTVINFFSPFIADPENLKIPYAKYEIDYNRNLESLKIENYFVCNLMDEDSIMYMYDQFFNKFLEVNSIKFSNEIDVLNFYKADKNIVYLNKPKHIENFALELSSIDKRRSKLIDDIRTDISDFLHPEYNLLKCIEKGIVYHHGSMPEIVRLYVEESFSSNKKLEFIVTSSTLLEGVNIPAEKIFLLTTKIGRANFSKSEFKNLTGRVCRFRELFGKETGSLRMLMPEIYVIKSKYEWSNTNPRNFLETKARIDLKMEDEVDNLLLKNDISKLDDDQLEKLHDNLEYLENIEPNTVEFEVEYVKSKIAKLCFKNNVGEFDIKVNERTLIKNLAIKKSVVVSDSLSLINLIYEIFIRDINFLNKNENDFLDGNRNFKRIENESAQKFYSKFLSWRCSSASYKEMIGYFMSYWRELPYEKREHVFVGKTWGEEKRKDTDRKALYINLNKKTNSQRINLAIVRIKEEQDFVDYSLMKYIEILNDLGMVEKEFYEKLKYCSSDKKIIALMKNGFSLELAKCITQDYYTDLIFIDFVNDQIKISEKIIEEMELNFENRILIFEIKYHIHY